MSVQLVIAEKPSVARSIAAVIGATEKQNGYWQGGGYLVSWCIGHLVSFAEAGQYDEKYCKWRYEDLPILPQPWQFIVPDEKKQQFEVLRALLNRPDVDSVIIQFRRREDVDLSLDLNAYFELVRACFKQRRKTINKNLREIHIERRIIFYLNDSAII